MPTISNTTNTTTIKKPRKSKKYNFRLKNVNTETVDQKYGITIMSNISVNEKPPENTTRITELSELNCESSSLEVISFLDETKRLYQCNVSMIDFKTGSETINMRYNCYWCRYTFDSEAIGCPIRYISTKAIKNYYSEVSKDFYTIKENITNHQTKMIEKQACFVFTPINKDNKKDSKNTTTIKTNKKEYYVTDGVFCSFNCCKAFIKDNKGHNNIYEHSDFLLSKLYYDMYNVKNVNINPAPHWRLLKEYGGHMTINMFRDNFNKSKFEPRGMINNSDLFKPSAMLYEEKLNF